MDADLLRPKRLPAGAHHREEVELFLGQAVLITSRALLVGYLDEHEFVDELFQPIGEDRAGNAEALLGNPRNGARAGTAPKNQ